MVKVHLGYVGKDDLTGFRFSRGNPALKSQLELIPFDLLSPITIMCFTKYLFIKNADTCSNIKLMGLRLSNMPLMVMTKNWSDKAVLLFMVEQKKYSLMYNRYKEWEKEL